jgi:hypothetical protein
MPVIGASARHPAPAYFELSLATQVHPDRVPSEGANPSRQIGLVRTSQKQKRTASIATLNHSRRFIFAQPPHFTMSVSKASGFFAIKGRPARREPASSLKGQLGLPIIPVDNFENHPAFEHFELEIGSMLPPIGRLSNAEPGLLAEGNKFIVGFESAADALVHHGEAVVCEGLVVHLAPLRKAVADVPSDGSLRNYEKVAAYARAVKPGLLGRPRHEARPHSPGSGH